MSQESNAIAGPSQPRSDNSSLHYHRCWWAWCRHSFYTRRDLLDHISTEHVQKARPERLQDILAHKKMEDENWDSFDNMSSPSLPSTFPGDVEPVPQAEKQQKGQSLDYIPSSLPSPPASTPHEIPATPFRVQAPAELLMSTDSQINHSRLFASPQLSNDPLTPFSKRSAPDTYISTPTFASLSSQPNTPSGRIYNIPDSPPFGALVEEALKTSKPTNYQPIRHGDVTLNSLGSDGSSQEFVFNQLTQGMDEENNSISQKFLENESMVIDDPSLVTSLPSRDNQTLSYSTPLSKRNSPAPQDDLGPLSPTRPSLQVQTMFTPPMLCDSSPTYLQSPTYSIGLGSPVVRQSWYQAPRRRRSSKKMSGSEAQASPLQPLAAEVTVVPPAEPKPGALQSKPVATLVASPSSLISELDQSTPQTQHSWTQSNSQTTGSYPPLQTQAPYRSQSMSQD